jgi:DNA polymerase
MIYSIDFESRSHIDLTARGLDVYANDPSTEVICIAYGTDSNTVLVQAPELMKYSKLIQHVQSGGKIQAWNALFEYAIWNCVCVPKYGWPPLKLEQCIDTMAIAAANNIPQSLEDAGSVMDAEYQKDPIGKKLIQKLCKPHAGVFNKDPELIKQLFDYCKQDVLTEMSIGRSLRPLDALEQQIWNLTNRINTIGVPVAIVEVENAVKAVKFAQNTLDQELLALTGCKPSERQKLLNWLNSQGAKLLNLTAETVTSTLKKTGLHPNVKRALELRQEGSQTSVAKYAKILEIQRNGRIRNTLVYHGASTGRFASRGGLNLQNIARPTLKDAEIADAIPRVFGNGVGTMQELSSLVRSAIKAPDGKTFIDVDFSSIENRVGVYVANQKDKVEMFRQGLDEYMMFASTSLYHIPYEDVTKEQRQIAKSAVLGCMFGQGAKGLVEYAKGMGVEFSLAQSQHAVDNYRAAYPKVKELWYACENAAISAVQDMGTSFGANNRVNLKADNRALWMKLLGGRLICWQRPMLEEVMTPWGQKKLAVTVLSQNTYTRKWGRNPLIGSSIFQSFVQGSARDFLANSMLSLDKEGYELCNCIHDEVLLLVDEERKDVALEDVVRIMTTPPSWASDFPLAAEGWEGTRYRK